MQADNTCSPQASCPKMSLRFNPPPICQQPCTDCGQTDWTCFAVDGRSLSRVVCCFFKHLLPALVSKKQNKKTLSVGKFFHACTAFKGRESIPPAHAVTQLTISVQYVTSFLMLLQVSKMFLVK